MKKRRLQVATAFILISLHIAHAQPSALKDMTLAPQIFSPEAASLGMYGKVPVSYSSGLPQVSIPLATLQAHGHPMEFSLDYHGGGIKPDQHPGWTGMGWNIRGGGCINRIVNGEKDELTRPSGATTPHPGYLFHAAQVQSEGLEQSSVQASIYNDFKNNHYLDYDREPDEFQVNLPEISASFYVDSYDSETGACGVKISSRSEGIFTVDTLLVTIPSNYEEVLFQIPNKNLITKNTSYISYLRITDNKGTVYRFGGDQSCIEFSYACTSERGGQGATWESFAVANTWLLREIEFTNGEKVKFEYKKDGIPVVVRDAHYAYSYVSGNSIVPFNSKSQQSPDPKYYNINFSFLKPSYLTKIRCEVGRDSIVFQSSRSNELSYPYTDAQIHKCVQDTTAYAMIKPSTFRNGDYCLRLDRMICGTRRIDFQYDNSASERLRLSGIKFKTAGGSDVCSYSMEYDPEPLPAYNSKKTDMWGYYNGLSYASCNYNTLGSFRMPSERYCKAGALTKIVYPTSGWTAFEWELNTFSSVLDVLLNPSAIPSGLSSGGGLRIKSMTDFDGRRALKRSFSYTDANSSSSGTLNGLPIFYASGNIDQATHTSGGGFWLLSHSPYGYYFTSETSLVQLPHGDGREVSYTNVTEIFQDGSRRKYRFSGHNDTPDQAPVNSLSNLDDALLINSRTSRHLGRGHLLETVSLDPQGDTLSVETRTYASASQEYMTALSAQKYGNFDIYRLSSYRIETGFPCLTNVTVTEYPDMQGRSKAVASEQSFRYNDDRLLSLRRTWYREDHLSGRDEVFRYTGDIPEMRLKGMTSFVRLEASEAFSTSYPYTDTTRTFYDGKRTEYTLNSGNGDYLPHTYSIAADSNGFGLDHAENYDWDIETTFNSYDGYSNLLRSKGRDDLFSSYKWGYGGRYLTAVVRGTSLYQYIDFESGTPLGNVLDGFCSDRAYRGSYSLITGNAAVKYNLDYMVLRGGVWVSVHKEVQGRRITINEGNDPIDNIRLYPQNTEMISATYAPLKGVSSITDVRGRAESYDYDKFGRLASVSDQEGNKKTSYSYNFFTRRPVAVSPEGGGPQPWNPGITEATIPVPYVGKTTYSAEGGSNPVIEETRFDLLGGPLCRVELGTAPDGSDIYTLTRTDCAGRDSLSWLPVPVADTLIRYAPADSVVEATAGSFYGDIFPFSQIIRRGASSDREIARFGPGAAWRSAGRSTKQSTAILGSGSITNDSLRVREYAVRWTRDTLPSISRGYSHKRLRVTRTEDEDGAAFLDFKDTEGRTVLSRKRVGGQNYDTYFSYDERGRLEMVIPPKLVFELERNIYDLDSLYLHEMAYMYRYDNRSRIIARKLPGCAWTFYVYDKADRLILTQTGNQRPRGEWTFTATDNLGRSSFKGLCYNPSIDIFEYGGSITDPVYVKPVFTDSPGDNIGNSYSFNYYGFTPNNPTPLETSLYDRGLVYRHDGYFVSDTVSASRQSHLYGYDLKGRLISVLSSVSGEDAREETFSYDFLDRVTSHSITASWNDGSSHSVEETCAYDIAGRRISTSISVDGGSTVPLSEISYDRIGRPSLERNGGTDSLATALSYDIRSAVSKREGTRLGETLWRESLPLGAAPFSKPSFSGNVTAIKTERPSGTGGGRRQTMSKMRYDPLSRLTGTTITADDDPLYLAYTYDLNGNRIRDSLLTADFIGSYTVVGSYLGNKRVHAAALEATGPEGSLLHNAYQFNIRYDNEGNVNYDPGFGISSIAYNCIGRPASVQRSDGSRFSYSWLPDGRKRSYSDSASTITYCDGFIYRNGILQTVMTDNGYIDFTGTAPRQRFFVKDYLGNVRSVTDGNGNVLEEFDYAPFGEIIRHYKAGPGANDGAREWRFSANELLSEFGDRIYDFQARFYSPYMGRFYSMDPLCEKYYDISPYAYCNNNPFTFVDPDGNYIVKSSIREWIEHRNNIEEQFNRINRKVERLHSKNRTNLRLEDRLNGLQSIMTTIDILESSSQGYALSNAESFIAGIKLDPYSKVIIISFFEGDTGSFVHEITHAGQLESGDIAFTADDGEPLGQDIYDELAAYKAQAYYNNEDINSITIEWIRGLKTPEGQLIYGLKKFGALTNTASTAIDINTSYGEYLKAMSQVGPINNLTPLYKIRNVYYKK